MTDIVSSRNSTSRTRSTILPISRSEIVLPSPLPFSSFIVRSPSAPNLYSGLVSADLDLGAYTPKSKDRRNTIERWRMNVIDEGTARPFDLIEPRRVVSEAPPARRQDNRSVRFELDATNPPRTHRLNTRIQIHGTLPAVHPPLCQTRRVSGDVKLTSVYPFNNSAKTSFGRPKKIPVYAEPRMPASSGSFTMLQKIELELANCRLERS